MNVNPDMKLWADLKEHFEGFRSTAYQDSGGVWTVGYGSTYNHDAKRKVKAGDSVTRAKAIDWMRIDASEVIRQANDSINVKLSASQSAGVCDYIYNRGIGNFLRTQLDELINAGADINKICAEIVGTGLKDRAGNLLWGLGRRRRSQAYLYKNGVLKFDFPRWGTFIP